MNFSLYCSLVYLKSRSSVTDSQLLYTSVFFRICSLHFLIFALACCSSITIACGVSSLFIFYFLSGLLACPLFPCCDYTITCFHLFVNTFFESFLKKQKKKTDGKTARSLCCYIFGVCANAALHLHSHCSAHFQRCQEFIFRKTELYSRGLIAWSVSMSSPITAHISADFRPLIA